MKNRMGQWLGVGILLGCLSLPAFGKNLIVESAWFEDVSGQMTLEEVQQQSFTPYSGLLTRGYSASVHWVRLRIDPALATTQQPHILRIQPQYLDYLTLFDPLAPTPYPRRTGDMTPWSNDEYQSLNFNFIVPVGDEVRDLYLRVETKSTTLVSTVLLPQKDVVRLDRQYEMFTALVLALLLLIVIWGGFQWSVERDGLLGSFVIKQLAVLTHGAGYMGYWRLWFSDTVAPATLNVLFSLNIFVMTATAIWFIYKFLKEYDPQPWAIRLFAGCLLFFPLQLVLQWLGREQLALQTISLLSLLLPFLGLYLAATARVWKTRDTEMLPLLSRRQLIVLFALLAVVLWIYVLPVLGLIQVEPLALYGIVLYNLVTSLMVTMALQLRARQRNRQQAMMQERLRMAEIEASQERAQREEQQRFLDMLTHELKTPLATIRLLSYGEMDQAGKIKTAIADMPGVIERCV